MQSPWSHLLVAGLLAACPFAAHAVEMPPSPATPQQLVVDTDSAPVVSVHDTVKFVEIVLMPSDEYRPIHPDSIDSDAGDAPADADTAK